MASVREEQGRPQEARRVDVLMKQSERKIRTMSLITQGQIKVWKAMLISLFLAGFVGALAWAVAFNKEEKSDAANRRVIVLTNIAPTAQISSPSFAQDGWGFINDNDVTRTSVMARNSRGEVPPYVDFTFTAPQKIKSIAIELDPDNDQYKDCGLHEFALQTSYDGQNFATALQGSTSNVSGFQEFALASEAKIYRLLLKSNHGNPNWTCLKEARLLQ